MVKIDRKDGRGMRVPEVDIILVNYRQSRLTIECVSSIKKSTFKNIKVIIVDNCSGDGSCERLTAKYANDTDVVVLCAMVNEGFSAGNNIGIIYALDNKADYIMLLNNDTIIACDMIEKLIAFANDSTVTTPKIYYFKERNRIWYAGGEYNRFTGSVTHFGINQFDSDKYDNSRKVTYASGCCVLISSKIVKRIGLLSEEYFMYGEDLDYVLRLENNGISIFYVSDAKLWHKVGASSVNSKLNIYYDTRNRFIIFHKYHFCVMAKWIFFTKILLLSMRGIMLNTNDRYFVSAFIDYKHGIKGKIDLDHL